MAQMKFFEEFSLPTPVRINLDELPENDDLLSPEPTASFVRSVKKYGVIWPIAVRESVGGYVVHFGNRRIKACRELDIPDILSYVFGPDDYIPDDISFIENEQRSDNPQQRAVSILGYAGTLTEKEIADKLNITVTEVKRELELGTAHPELMQAWLQGRIRTSAMRKVVKRPKREQDLLVDMLHEGEAINPEAIKTVRGQVGRELSAMSPVLMTADMGDVPYVTRAQTTGDGVAVEVWRNGIKQEFNVPVEKLLEFA